MIYTVFPDNEHEMPQDFESWHEAYIYAEENFSEYGYTIATTEGNIV